VEYGPVVVWLVVPPVEYGPVVVWLVVPPVEHLTVCGVLA
jgi:hypothetical protein